jgi:murein DD-endopeptidase MepM/ murein hydrolase activator NlpD
MEWRSLGGCVQIILVSKRLSKARSVEITWVHLAAALGICAAVVAFLAFSISYMGVRHAAEIKLPLLQSLVVSAQREQAQQSQYFMRQNLNAMAVRLGQMQAQLTRLDALGERLSSSAGLAPGEFRFNELPGRGGVLTPLSSAHELSLSEFSRQLDAVALQMDTRTDVLGTLESQLLDQRIKQRLLTTSLPLADGSWNASGFGYRLDPFTGEESLHEGIDFFAPTGAAIYAAASGAVVSADFHPGYGYMVDIDHGNDLVTRYAHASRLLVKTGELVKRGQLIAEVGSTGRSTGPHLHFEVRYRGIPQNPNRFIQASAR